MYLATATRKDEEGIDVNAPPSLALAHLAQYVGVVVEDVARVFAQGRISG